MKPDFSKADDFLFSLWIAPRKEELAEGGAVTAEDAKIAS